MIRRSAIGLADVGAALAIVAVVAAVIAPVVKAQSDEHKSASDTCLSNLRQLGLGMLMYTQDYDERFPSGSDWYGSGSGWACQIYPYVKSDRVYKCPSEVNPKSVVSYGYNSNMVHLSSYVPSAPMGLPLAAAASPAVTVVLFEVANNFTPGAPGYSLLFDPTGGLASDVHRTSSGRARFAGYSPAGRGTGRYAGELSGMGFDNPPGTPILQYATGPMGGSSPNSPYFTATGRHNGDSNFCFLDGHAVERAASTVSAGKDNPVAGSCGGDGVAANTSCAGPTTATFSLQ